jgi:PAS domain S-box-containing protein
MEGTIRVLLVDDAVDFASVAAELLEREDDRLDVTTVTDGTVGLDRLEAETFDCLVSDYRMPGMDGLELLEAVRERWPALPFVLFTGKGSEEIASDAISAGATEYVRKGTTADGYALLANRIVQAVSKRRARERASRFERLQELAREINGALVRAEDRESVERTVCERLAGAEQYVWAAIATPTVEDGDVTAPGVRSAVTDTDADAIDGDVADIPAVRAAATEREPAVSDGSAVDGWAGAAGAAAVPLEYESEYYGVLVVGPAAAVPSDEFERDLLAELGIDVAGTLHNLDVRSDLRESEAKYRRLVEGNLVGVYLIQDGEFEYVNPRLAAMFGYTRAELQSEVTPFDLVEEADHETLRRNLDRRISGEVDDLQYTLRGRRKDGTPIEFEVHGGRIDYRGEPAVMGTLLDVTERKRYERELERSRAEYRELFDAFPEAVFVRPYDGTFQAVNDTAVDRLGYSRDELLSMRPQDIDPNVDAGDGPERTGDFERGRIERFDTVHETKSGERIPVEINATLIPYRGETAILSTARDITDRVSRERELERQNERLEDLASVVSHDLRNPLNVAAGRLEWAREECDSPHLDDAASAVGRMDDLIDDLSALAEHERGAVEPVALDLGSLVARCWANVATSGATLERSVEATVLADEGRLAQVFENLFRNAVEHGSTGNRTESGDAVEHGSTGNRTGSGDAVEHGSTDDDPAGDGGGVTITVGGLPNGFYVADDGPGIPESARDRVIEAGYSTNADGTGLGLAIVRDVVDAHGWEIAVAESDAGGARFEITGVESA